METVLQQIPLSARHALHRFQGFRRTDEARADNPTLQGHRMQSLVSGDDIESRLINWGRWCKMGEHMELAIAGSIEWQWVGRWKENMDGRDAGDSEMILDRVNVLDAEKFNQSWCIYQSPTGTFYPQIRPQRSAEAYRVQSWMPRMGFGGDC